MTESDELRRRFAITHVLSLRRVDFGRKWTTLSRRMRQTSTTSWRSCTRRRTRCWGHVLELSGRKTSSSTSKHCQRSDAAEVLSRAARMTTIDIRQKIRRRRPASRAHAQKRPECIRSCRCAARRSRDHIRYRERARRSPNCRRRQRCAVPAVRRRRNRVQTSSSRHRCSTLQVVAFDSCSYTRTFATHKHST